MSILGNDLLLGSGDEGYNLTRSLRFRSSASASLSRTPASAGNRKTWTWSAWVKRGALSSNQVLFVSKPSATSDATFTTIGFSSSNTLLVSGYSVQWRNTTQVFRDPSAWYHIVVTWDTTQATAANRVKVYVNGSQVTAFGTTFDPSLNFDGAINQADAHYFCYPDGYSYSYFDGYLTEVNFVDGQGLTPSSFGETDTTTGVWKPKRYAGTYGTNGFYLPFNYQSATAYAGSFNGTNQYLSLAQNSAFNFGTGDFTVETWVYANSWSSTVSPIISLGDGAVGGGSPIYSGWALRYSTGAGLGWYRYDGTETHLTNNIFLATNQWIHIAVSRASGVLKMFVNGAQVYSASNTTSYNNVNSNTLKIGGNWTVGGPTVTWFNGYMSNVRIVNNTGLYTANFAPSTTNLTAVSGTALLTLQDSSIVDNSTNAFTITNNNSVSTSLQNIFGAPILTADQSGNSNNWQSYNISLASGVTYDSMTDVPTLTSATAANFAVVNPIGVRSGGNPLSIITEANLKALNNSGSAQEHFGTIAVTSGKYYWEATVQGSPSGQQNYTGVYTTTPETGFAAIMYSANGDRYQGGWLGASWATYTSGDVIGVALDVTNGSATFYKNNTSQGSLTFTAGSPCRMWGLTTTNGSGYCYNHGQRPFTYTPPTGYVALNTYNLPTSTIVKGNTVMDATTWTGNGTTQSITNAAGFKPDFVWIKNRNNVRWHILTDSVRGNNKQSFSNDTAAEESRTDRITAFNSNGFSVGSYTDVNLNADTFVGWQWQAGQGTTSSNTSGTITSTVSVNASAGFSVVTYTGTGAAATVGHGLGVAPQLIIGRSRTNSFNWGVWHKSLQTLYGDNAWLRLNTTDAYITSFDVFDPQNNTSSVFGIGSEATMNASGSNFVAYCWTPIAGYSAFGSYTGNGSTDGPFIYTGFRPKFIMSKVTTASNWWIMFDSTRNPYNAANYELAANLSDAEYTANTSQYTLFDFLSNGFKLRTGSLEGNSNGQTYIYMAFAENPFKNALAR